MAGKNLSKPLKSLSPEDDLNASYSATEGPLRKKSKYLGEEEGVDLEILDEKEALPVSNVKVSIGVNDHVVAQTSDINTIEVLDIDDIDSEESEDILEEPKVPSIVGCRDVSDFEFMAKLGDGTYGIVSKVRDKVTKKEYAMKGIKMEEAKEGFPLQSLREIKTLMTCVHPNVVNLHEVVVGNAGANVYLIMEYAENDLYSLMEARETPFTIAEAKCLLKQLLSGVAHLHEHWVVHRDLKPANLLLNNKGILKLADFGLAREYGSPLHPMTAGVVTLRYRAPEVLLGSPEYSPSVDIWSVGCIFAELITKQSLFAGHNELEQLDKIFKILGTPNDKIWPGYSSLPSVKNFYFVFQPYSTLKKSLPQLSEQGFSLLKSMFVFDPSKRITAKEALYHPYFDENPLPMDPELMPTHRPKVDGKVNKEALNSLLQNRSPFSYLPPDQHGSIAFH